jgi:hypothetical protein
VGATRPERDPGQDGDDYQEPGGEQDVRAEQGWSLLCNGVVLFEDTGALLPSGHSIPPHRPAVTKMPAQLSWPAAA